MASIGGRPQPAQELTEEEKLRKLYGNKLPNKKMNPLNKSLQQRKYFDSGDYALSKAGKADPKNVGSEHASPDNIPHVSPPNIGAGVPLTGTSPTNGMMAASPVKESGLAKETTEIAEEPLGA